jgi:hypothetical protein
MIIITENTRQLTLADLRTGMILDRPIVIFNDRKIPELSVGLYGIIECRYIYDNRTEDGTFFTISRLGIARGESGYESLIYADDTWYETMCIFRNVKVEILSNTLASGVTPSSDWKPSDTEVFLSNF